MVSSSPELTFDGKDKKAFELFADVKPLDLESSVNLHQVRATKQSARARCLKPGEPGFAAAVTEGLVSVGLAPELAASLAEQEEIEGAAKDTLDAVSRIAKEQRPKKAPKLSKLTGASAEVHYPDFTDRQGDYRRAILEAARHGTSIVEQLKRLGQVRSVEELIPLGC